MPKLLLILGILLLTAGILFYFSDFLPIDFLSKADPESDLGYYKVAPTDGFSIFSLRLPLVLIGAVLILISRYIP